MQLARTSRRSLLRENPRFFLLGPNSSPNTEESPELVEEPFLYPPKKRPAKNQA